MPKHISKQQLVKNILSSIQDSITKNNVDVALPILTWTQTKIQLAFEEKQRTQKYIQSNRQQSKPRHVKRGYIYYAKLGKNIGSEQNDFRPVLVVQAGKGNATSNTVIIIPLTDAIDKHGNPKRSLGTHVEITHPNLEKKSIIKTEHIHNISKNRLQTEVGFIGSEKLKEVDKKLKVSLGLT